MDGQMDVVGLEKIYIYIYTEESIAKASSPQDKLFKLITIATGQDRIGWCLQLCCFT